MTFGERLRVLRESHEMSRADLAARLGLSYWAVAKYEQGERVPTHEILSQLAGLFGTSVDYLIGRTNEDADRLMSTARRLAAIRHSRGITQRELAARLDIDVAEVARYENAVAPLPDELVDRLADVFDVDRRYFTAEIDQAEIEKLLGETWFRAPAELSPEARKSVEDFIAFVIAQEERKKRQES